MPVLRRFGFGMITSVTRSDGTPYDGDEFRTAYVDVPGLVMFYESLNKFPGKFFCSYIRSVKDICRRTSIHRAVIWQ